MSRKERDHAQELRSQLEEWNMGLDELQSRVDRAESEKQAELNERLRRLREDYDSALARFDASSESGTETWDDFREGMLRARALLDEALEEAGGSSSP